MRRYLYVILLLLLASCNVHEWPETPEYSSCNLKLRYQTDMTEWSHLFDNADVTEQGYGESYDNHLKYGKIRYTIRAYPISEKQRTSDGHTYEIVYVRDIDEGYDFDVTLKLLPGNYNIVVWSDLVSKSGEARRYNPRNFSEIIYNGDHRGNDDFKDAFRGSGSVYIESSVEQQLPPTLEIDMQRPLAKFEFITNDLDEFLDKEATRFSAMESAEDSSTPSSSLPTRVLNVEDYRVVFYYVGFMPSAYSIFTDRPVDSSTGVMFDSTMKQLSDTEASLGFDYVFVNGKESAVTVQIAIYDKEGKQLSLTEPINVSLQRNHHTILKGSCLMTEASGGVTINPDFDGDHNIMID